VAAYAGVMTDTRGELADCLRAARARVEPADVGLRDGISARRVPGLRREEVAVLAGVSADYYTKLEQGRERSPSPQVLNAVARALRMPSDAREHLFRLAGLAPRSSVGHAPGVVHPELLALLDFFPDAAAYVLGPAFDVLAANVLATALLAPFEPERNMPKILFTHPQARAVFEQWSTVTSATVYALRYNAARFRDDEAIRDLVGELSTRSTEFTQLWNDRSVGALKRAFKVFRHPAAGRIELTYQTFDTPDAPGQQLLVGLPVLGSRSAEALTFLGSMAG
jgi:transcriptional regulator with XRE-family HTH domain